MSVQDEHVRRLSPAIGQRSARIGVIGLGYVGLPLACSFANAGFPVIGVDLDQDRIDMIRRGASPIGGDEPGLEEMLWATTAGGRLRVTTDYGELSEARIITINVDTPVDHDGRPDYTSLSQASRSLAKVVNPGSLTIVESTVSPGTTMNLVGPLLAEGSGLEIGVDLLLGACPERVMPGRLLSNLRTVPRVCGGSSPEVSELMRLLYSSIVEAPIDTTDITTAELVKVTENAYRDVQIAFANEVSLICDSLGIDVWQVRELVNKVPFRAMHRPGGGVGGHCIPKDPWLLAAASERPLQLIPAARNVNDAMPHEVARRLRLEIEEWRATHIDSRPVTVAVLGYTYLADSDDIRNSPSIDLVTDLESFGYEVRIHDPFLPQHSGPLNEVLDGCIAAVVMVPHTAYDGLEIDLPVVLKAGRRE
jgi:UDP-N-acetyl-D-mannosaminuronic acid dehydrogenase